MKNKKIYKIVRKEMPPPTKVIPDEREKKLEKSTKKKFKKGEYDELCIQENT